MTQDIMTTSDIRISRSQYLASKVVFVDGIEGCGKTMLAPIIAAMDRVELLTYAYEIEHLCALYDLKKLEIDAAAAVISLLVDLQLYNAMQSREVNFRPSDLSSVFRSSQPLRYIRRLFGKGNEHVLERLKAEKPILLLTTHKMVAYCEPIFAALADRAVFIEVVRHPLYMVIQNALNFEALIGTPRDFSVYYERDGNYYPFFAYGREKEYASGNPFDRAIYHIENMMLRSEAMRKKYSSTDKILTVPFEKFVIDPSSFMKEFTDTIGTALTTRTLKMMKRQNVPRKKYSDSIDLEIYRRCGWEPPKRGYSERQEFDYRRKFIMSQASPNALKTLDTLCDKYEELYMNGCLRQGSGDYI
jgi:hypothetical protein